jgi:hypothetical protein
MESIMGERCAVDAEGVAKIIAAYRQEHFYDEVRNVQVDFDTLTVTYECKSEWIDEWEACEAKLIDYEIVQK